MEDAVVEGRHALGSVGREKKNVGDGLRAAVVKGLHDLLRVLVDGGAVEDEGERIAIETLHSLREAVINELQQHRAIDALHLCTSPLLGREDLG